MRLGRGERGQSAVEVALILAVFLLLTAGLIDAGRTIFLYNELSAISRYGARWGAVVGGTCALPYASSSSDWCDQIGGQTSNFWAQDGNKPIQGYGAQCPSYASNASDWYSPSSYLGSTATTIVGAVVQKFDTDANNTNLFRQVFAPGIDVISLRVCIATTNTTVDPSPGDSITVDVYYPFAPASKMLGTGTFRMTAESEYIIE
jgi:hypothetical protein